jgi:hypothetical protein
MKRSLAILVAFLKELQRDITIQTAERSGRSARRPHGISFPEMLELWHQAAICGYL